MKKRKNIITVAIDSPAAAGAGTQAKLIAKKFGDRCKNFITLNEPAVFSTFGYLDGYMAPGLKNKKKYIYFIFISHLLSLMHHS